MAQRLISLLFFFIASHFLITETDSLNLETGPGLEPVTWPESCPIEPATSHYEKLSNPTLNPSHLSDLPGFTRSVFERDHAVISVESQVFGPLLGWRNTNGAHLITPAIAPGTHFTLYFANMAANSNSSLPSSGVERFIFVVKGEASLAIESESEPGNLNYCLTVDGYAYIPPNVRHHITSATSASLLVVERVFQAGQVAGDVPGFVVGSTEQQPLVPVPGEVFELRKLLPAQPNYDFNIHVMDFLPGEYLNVKEVHYNQHGLVMLEGRGIYRLSDKWYSVQAGDVIWMAPFVPQWYAALGKDRTRYFLYKDVHRDPLTTI